MRERESLQEAGASPSGSGSVTFGKPPVTLKLSFLIYKKGIIKDYLSYVVAVRFLLTETIVEQLTMNG